MFVLEMHPFVIVYADLSTRMPLLLDHLPFEACARLWDVILLEGDSFLFRVALAILATLESRLFFPDRNELLEVLKWVTLTQPSASFFILTRRHRGENKAAIEVAKRQGVNMEGGKYEIYGLDEECVRAVCRTCAWCW
jgi:hypothetical protein